MTIEKKYRGSDKLKLAVAIPKIYDQSRKFKLYTFFPVMNVDSPFNALLHATFALTDNRNDLDISSDEEKNVNAEILSHLLKY